jgi:hypothetical protein
MYAVTHTYAQALGDQAASRSAALRQSKSGGSSMCVPAALLHAANNRQVSRCQALKHLPSWHSDCNKAVTHNGVWTSTRILVGISTHVVSQREYVEHPPPLWTEPTYLYMLLSCVLPSVSSAGSQNRFVGGGVKLSGATKRRWISTNRWRQVCSQALQGQRATAQHKAQHSTAQHSTAQHSTAQHSTAQHSTAQHSTNMRCGGTTMHKRVTQCSCTRSHTSSCVARL